MTAILTMLAMNYLLLLIILNTSNAIYPGDESLIFESFENLSNWEDFEYPESRKKTEYTIIHTDTSSYLKAESRSSASGLIHKKRFNPQNTPILEWRWRIVQADCPTDGREKSGDDYPFRIFILFDDDSAAFSLWETITYSALRLIYGFDVPESSLCFVWTNIKYEEKYYNNPFSNRVKIIPLTAKPDMINRWVHHKVNIDSVFQTIYKRSCPEKAALAIMSDTDNTGGSAIVYLDYIFIRK
jgi:hypothetical protein